MPKTPKEYAKPRDVIGLLQWRGARTLVDKASGMDEDIETGRAEYKNPLDPATE